MNYYCTKRRWEKEQVAGDWWLTGRTVVSGES